MYQYRLSEGHRTSRDFMEKGTSEKPHRTPFLTNVWCKKGKTYDKKNTMSTVNHGSRSVLLCVFVFAAAGSGKLHCVTGTMDLWNTRPFWRRMWCLQWFKLKSGNHWTFQQDNNPKSTKALNPSCNVLEWLSQPLDSNPFENLWQDLKKAVAAQTPNNISELEAFAHEEFVKSPKERCQKLVRNSWKPTLEVWWRYVIKGKGSTKYWVCLLILWNFVWLFNKALVLIQFYSVILYIIYLPYII